MICRRRVRQALESGTTRPTPIAVGVVDVLTTSRRKHARLVDTQVLRRDSVSIGDVGLKLQMHHLARCVLIISTFYIIVYLYD